MANQQDLPSGAGSGAETAPRCVRCDEPMERGVILDRAHHTHGRELPWARAVPPVRAFAPLPQTRSAPPREVQTFRCPSCGRLESFAP